MTSNIAEFVLLLVVIIPLTSARAIPLPGLVLQEVEFSGGAVGTSSVYSTNPSYAAENAFKQTNAHWNSGRDPDGSGELTQPYPHLIWYDFRTAFVPGRVSFRPRMSHGCGFGKCGATKWQFIGTNDEKCDRYSKWTILCEDLSGEPFKRPSQSKYCTVDDNRRKAFRCLGISVLEGSYEGQSEVSLGGIKMWKKILEDN